MPEFSDISFKETWRSGRSDRRFPSILSQAPGILWVAIVQDKLLVSPHFPFNLGLVGEALGWDHIVPGNSIVEVQVPSSGRAAGSVKLRYRHLTGDEEMLHLVVQDREAFVAALAKIRVK